jgi:ribonuclease HIII
MGHAEQLVGTTQPRSVAFDRASMWGAFSSFAALLICLSAGAGIGVWIFMPSPSSDEPKPLTLHNTPLTLPQAQKLRGILTERGWKFEVRPYMIFFAQKDKTNVSVYEKGPKVLIQGKGTQEFVQFILEPEVLGEARLGYEELHSPEMYTPHFGIDESGKGDFFGPLVIAGVYTDADSAPRLQKAGIMDSKRITSDARIRELAQVIRKTDGVIGSVIPLAPVKYNELYRKFGNLNKLLAWGHAQVIENLLKRQPDCPRALSDQFADPALIQRNLNAKKCKIELQSRTKAESDVAVAAASIIAREHFINWLRDTGATLGATLPKGVSAAVKSAAVALVKKEGIGVLDRVAKTHFRTAAEVAPEHFTAKPKVAWVGRRKKVE